MAPRVSLRPFHYLYLIWVNFDIQESMLNLDINVLMKYVSCLWLHLVVLKQCH